MISVSPAHDIRRAVPLLSELRNTLDPDTFAKRLTAAVEAGYQIMIAEQDGVVVGVLGYRIALDLCWGSTFYIDDLNVDPTLRSSGVGAQLLTAAKSAAREAGCDHIRLCSGLTRTDAHRFYEAQGMQGFSKQFVFKVENSP